MTPDRQFSDPRLAELYDLGNAGSDDRDFYLNLAGPPPQDILDLGCGTGLLTRAYAARGHQVVGADPADAMLDVARRGAHAADVEWIESTSEAFSSPRRFDLIIMTGHAFQVLLSDEQVSAALQNMALHLKPAGLAVFESRNPHFDWDAIWARAYTMQTPNGTVRAARRMTDTSRAPDYLSFAWDYEFDNETVTSDSTLRFMAPDQIIEHAKAAGLTLADLCGDWNGADFEPGTSREMIFKFQLDPGR